MSYSQNVGHVGWVDLTVPDAEKVSEFYRQVVGWEPKPHDMGEYNDFNMFAGEECVAGVCHARGPNASIPAQWMIYVSVPSVADAAASCRAAGGTVVDGPRTMGEWNFCIVRDPAGAVMALLSKD